jgi:hypothetical protein
VTNISEVSQTSSTIDSDYSFLRSTLRSTKIQNRKSAKKKKTSSVAKPVRPVKLANRHRLVIALWLGLSAFSVLVLRLWGTFSFWNTLDLNWCRMVSCIWEGDSTLLLPRVCVGIRQKTDPNQYVRAKVKSKSNCSWSLVCAAHYPYFYCTISNGHTLQVYTGSAARSAWQVHLLCARILVVSSKPLQIAQWLWVWWAFYMRILDT